jgi:hypothetical protein
LGSKYHIQEVPLKSSVQKTSYAGNTVTICALFTDRISSFDHIFCIRQILEKKWEYNGAVHQLFVDFKKAHDSGRREVLYNIHIEFGIPLKLVRLIKMCLNETYSRV